MPAEGKGHLTTLSGKGSPMLIVVPDGMRLEGPLVKRRHTR
jgi:hypothetical protein